MKISIYLLFMILVLTLQYLPDLSLTVRQMILRSLDNNLNAKDSCIICIYMLQQIKKTFDSDLQCPDLLNSFSVKERQRNWQPDPQYFSKCNLLTLGQQLMDAKKFEDLKKHKGIVPDGDHVYYVAHKESKLGQYDNNHNQHFTQEQLNKMNFQQQNQIIENLNIKKPKFFKELSVLQSPQIENISNKDTFEFINHKQQQIQANKTLGNEAIPNEANLQLLTNKNMIYSSALQDLYKKNMQVFNDLLKNQQKNDEVKNQTKKNDLNATIFLQQNILISKNSTILDIRHPNTQRTVDNTTGIHKTLTDMEINEFFNPLDETSLKLAINKNNNEFLHSDKTQNNFSNQNLEKQLFRMNSQNQKKMGSIDKTTVLNKEHQNVNFQTDIDITSPNKYEIKVQSQYKRVQTNNPFGVNVNKDHHNYGKTIHQYENYSDQSFIQLYKKKKDNFSMIYNKKDLQIEENLNQFQENILKNQILGIQGLKEQEFEIPELFMPYYQLQKKLQSSNMPKEQQKEILQQFKNDNNIDCCFIEPCFNITPCKTKNIYFKRQSFLEQESIEQKLRRRTRFSDGQFNCVRDNLFENLNYYCQEEIPMLYKNYCNLFKQQINVLIEKILFQDSIESICQELIMC